MKFILTIIGYILIMNVAAIAAALLFNGEYNFNIITGIAVPVLCAYTARTVKAHKKNNAQ